MDGFRSELYGDRAAATYDDRYADFRPSEAMLDLLCEYADSSAVEVGVGTGRVAIPLAERGIRITGVDVSSAMIERLAENAGTLPITELVADAGSFTLPAPTHFIYCVFNTFYQLGDANRQAAFLRNAADNLTDGGTLLVEIGIFDTARVSASRGVNVMQLDAERVVLQIYSIDSDQQRINKQEVTLRHGEPVHLVPSVQHYLSPAELVNMAGKSSLTTVALYGSWSKEPFTPDSTDAIIVLQKTEHAR